MSPSAVATNWYQTLASVAGAPQGVPPAEREACASASAASVVARVVSTEALNGSEPITTRPPYTSLPGAVAASALDALNATSASPAKMLKSLLRMGDVLSGFV